MFKYVSIYFIILLLSISCAKKVKDEDRNYIAEEFSALLTEVTALNPVGDNAIPFADYAPGVNRVNSKTLKYERLLFYAVEFESVKLAKEEAARLNQYYSRNILFDRVEGEPILEDFVIKTFDAKNPNRKIQRKPKAAEHGGGHGEVHGEAHGDAHGAPAHH